MVYGGGGCSFNPLIVGAGGFEKTAAWISARTIKQLRSCIFSAEVTSGVSLTRTGVKWGAQSSKNAADLKKHLGYIQKYGTEGVKELANGRIRYYGSLVPSRNHGTIAGCRYVHEFNPAFGRSRGWLETIDHNKITRQVRPQLKNQSKEHYKFDSNGNYIGSW